MLDRAQALLLQILDELSPEIEAGIPIVGLEPSCIAVFRDELLNLFPHDERAQALSRQTFLLSEFLETHAKDFPFPRFDRKALLHGHCHHKSLMKMTAEESVLHRLGIDFQSPAPGCCGMAGSFGFEPDKYELSHRGRGTRTPPRRPPGTCRLADYRRRLQLPRADRPGNAAPCLAPGRSPANGAHHSRRPRHARLPPLP